jgi:hypothetical protein
VLTIIERKQGLSKARLGDTADEEEKIKKKLINWCRLYLNCPPTQQQKKAGRYLPFPSVCLFSPPDALAYAKMLFPTQKEETKKEGVKFPGKIKKGVVIIPDDNITW